MYVPVPYFSDFQEFTYGMSRYSLASLGNIKSVNQKEK